MQKRGCYLVAFCMLAGACGKNERNEAAATAGAAGTSGEQGGSGASAGSPKGIELDVSGGGTGAAPSGGRPPVDLSSVVIPVVRCGPTAAGGADDGAGGSTGGAEAETSAGGASWDDTCSPPPSTCVGDLTLVYFDAGECVDGFCDWQKQSLDCRNSCYEGGCQDSITTK